MDTIDKIKQLASKYRLTCEVSETICIKNHKDERIYVEKITLDHRLSRNGMHNGWCIYIDINVEYTSILEHEIVTALSKWLDRIVDNKSKIAIDYIENIIRSCNIRYTRTDNFIDFQYNNKLGEIRYFDGYYRACYGKLVDGVTCDYDSITIYDYESYTVLIWDELSVDEGVNKIIEYLVS